MLKIDESKISTNGRKILVDFENLCNRTLIVDYDPLDSKLTYWKQKMIVTLNYMIKDLEPSQVVMCHDSSSWRKEVYPEYKANRKARYENKESKINWEKYFEVKKEYVNFLHDVLKNFYWLKVDRAEADDIIGTICKHFPSECFTIVSTDRDFHQLLKFKNVKQFTPIKKEYVNVHDPELSLRVKILTGDGGDNVPAVRPKMGEKTALKLLNGKFDEEYQNPDFKAAFDRNNMLINLDCTPSEIVNEIVAKYANYTEGTFEKRKFGLYLMNNMPAIWNKSDEYIRNFSKINNKR